MIDVETLLTLALGSTATTVVAAAASAARHLLEQRRTEKDSAVNTGEDEDVRVVEPAGEGTSIGAVDADLKKVRRAIAELGQVERDLSRGIQETS